METVTVEWQGVDIECDVEFNYYAGSKGYRNSYGVPEEPDEGESIEVESIHCLNDNSDNIVCKSINKRFLALIETELFKIYEERKKDYELERELFKYKYF